MKNSHESSMFYSIIMGIILFCIVIIPIILSEKRDMIIDTENFFKKIDAMMIKYYIKNNKKAENLSDLDSYDLIHNYLYSITYSNLTQKFQDYNYQKTIEESVDFKIREGSKTKLIEQERLYKERLNVPISHYYNSYSIYINNLDLGWGDCSTINDNINQYVEIYNITEAIPELTICESDKMEIIFSNINIKEKANKLIQDIESRRVFSVD